MSARGADESREWEDVASTPKSYDFRYPSVLSEAPKVVCIKYTDVGLDNMVNGLGRVVSFDLEWVRQGTVDIITLADVKTILVIQVTGCRDDELPSAIVHLMQDGDRRKVGVAILGDAILLGTVFDVVPQHLFDLSGFAKTIEALRWRNRGKVAIGLQTLCEVYLGRQLAKEAAVRCGNWADELGDEQVHYAACDVFACLELYYALDRIRINHEETTPTNFANCVFNCDRNALDAVSNRRANKALSKFEELKQQAPKDQQARVSVDGIETSAGSDCAWEGYVKVDGRVVARGYDDTKQRAKGRAAKAAMSGEEWKAWFHDAHPTKAGV